MDSVVYFDERVSAAAYQDSSADSEGCMAV